MPGPGPGPCVRRGCHRAAARPGDPREPGRAGGERAGSRGRSARRGAPESRRRAHGPRGRKKRGSRERSGGARPPKGSSSSGREEKEKTDRSRGAGGWKDGAGGKERGGDVLGFGLKGKRNISRPGRGVSPATAEKGGEPPMGVWRGGRVPIPP